MGVSVVGFLRNPNLWRIGRGLSEKPASVVAPIRDGPSPSVELLERTHEFPCAYTFKVIGRREEGFVARAVAAVRDELDEEVDPPYSVRETAGGGHIAVSVEPHVQNAWEVLAVYQRLSRLPGLEYVF